jgi:alpha-1,3-rhamnosyl/mannosyltransferase
VHGGYLLSVSTLEPRKNLAGLVEAYEQARPSLPGGLPLVVVGPQGWGEAIVEPGATRPWSEVLDAPGVVHVGPVSDGVLAALYSGARTFVYVPFVEGFGLPPLEAMRQGAPVVASTGVPSVAIRPDRPPTAMLVDPTDPAAVAAALVAVTTDDAVRAALADAGSHDAAGRTWREAAEAHVALWTSLARGVR